MADDSLRSRTDDVRLFQFLAAGDSNHRQLRRESIHVFRFFLQETLRDEQRQVYVLMAGGFEASIELPLQNFPDGIAIRLNDHAAFDDFRRLGHIALQYDILIPGSEIFFAGSDGRFCHGLGITILVDSQPKQLAAVLMHKYEGMEYVEIAEVLQCSLPALKSLLFRAYETLRHRLAHFALV